MCLVHLAVIFCVYENLTLCLDIWELEFPASLVD